CGRIPLGFNYDHAFFIAVGDNWTRRGIAARLSGKALFSTIVHATAKVSKRVVKKEGTVVTEGAIIKVNTTIGRHAIVNIGASVDHDCIIGDFVHIAPQATLCGEITIGEGTLVGANALILPRITIGSWCTIGAGSTVTRDVPDGATWIGNTLKPAGLILQTGLLKSR